MYRYSLTLDDSAIAFARDNLNETKEKQSEYIQKIRDHFAQHEQATRITSDDDVLVAFLRGCKYNLEKTIVKLCKFYKMRSDLPNIFSQRDPMHPRMVELLSLGAFVPLRKTNDGRIIIIIRPACYSPKEFKFEEVLKIGYVVLDVCSKICPAMQVYGVCAVFDMKGVGLAHARPMTPTIIKHMVHSWENYHCRPKQLEFINAPMYISVVLNIFKSFMSAKLKERVRVHFGGNSALHEFVDKAALPEEYGGEDGKFSQHVDFWRRQVQEYGQWLKFDEQFRVYKDINEET
ncbi:retinol-binding protein pinta-like [Atheta coriaria]|uniref:retinol-binding protein pinta-like n=1 Tax=Dalotia coriaria TaxID=877792 RepID=UPI0031F3E933